MTGATRALGSADRIVGCALFAAALLAHAVHRMLSGLWGALGSDAVLWGLAAKNLQVGAPSPVPPLYPALVALVEAAGVPLVPAGWGVAMVAAAAVPAVVWWTARWAGASRGASGLAALVAIASPDLAGWAQQIQPDSLTALALACLAWLLGSAASGSRVAAWGAAAVGGLAPMLREHGLVLAPTAAFALFVLGHRGAAAGCAVAWVCAPMLVGQAPSLDPLGLPWSDRAGGALASLDASVQGDLGYVREMPPGPRAAYLALVQAGDRAGQIRWHAARSLARAGDGWLALALVLAAAAVSRERRIFAMAVPLASILPALAIWSHRRHVLVAAPLVALLGAATAGRRTARVLGAIAALVLLAYGALDFPAAIGSLRNERFGARRYSSAAGWIAANAGEGALLAGYFRDVALYSPLPAHTPDGSPADWHALLVTDRAAPTGWQRVHLTAEGLGVWRYRPDGVADPCPDGRPAPDTPYVGGRDPVRARMLGCPPPTADR